MPTHVYEVRPRKHHRGVNLISDALPFGGLWYAKPNAFRRRDARLQSRSFARWNQSLRRDPSSNPTMLIVTDLDEEY